MKDIIIGLWLMLSDVYYKHKYGNDIKYVAYIRRRPYASDKPFGSKWLTKRSNVWMPRTKNGMKALESSNGMLPDDSYILTKDLTKVEIEWMDFMIF